jgi:hypothetical protein
LTQYGDPAVSGATTKATVSGTASNAVANRIKSAEPQGSVAVSGARAESSGKGSTARSDTNVGAIGGSTAAGAASTVAVGTGASSSAKQTVAVDEGSVGAGATYAQAAGDLSQASALLLPPLYPRG